MTQEQLASMLGVQQSTICHIEREVRDPSMKLLCRIAEALGTTLDELVKAR